MILRKVAILVGLDGQSYWEAMIVTVYVDKYSKYSLHPSTFVYTSTTSRRLRG